MAAASSITLSILRPKPWLSPSTPRSSLQIASALSLPPPLFSAKRGFFLHTQKNTQIWGVSAVAEDALPSVNTAAVENSQQISSSGDDSVSTVVSALLFLAFIGLSILTIGVIYLGVTDFLQKKEKEKFEREEAERKKKSGRKRRVRARAGPRGFGQRVGEDEYDGEEL